MFIDKTQQKPIISMIAAMAKDRIIGYQGKMPWHLPADLAWFKKITLNKPIIMGRKTFESIGHPLPKRQNIVISRQNDYRITDTKTKVNLVHSIEEAFSVAEPTDEIFIIGGGALYERYLEQVDKLYLTQIDLSTKGDTYFPMWKEGHWNRIFLEAHNADEVNAYNYCFEIYKRK